MKTASEWASESKDAICWANEEGQCGCEGACNLLLKFARAVQADAIRAAAGVCEKRAEEFSHGEQFPMMGASLKLYHDILSLIQD